MEGGGRGSNRLPAERALTPPGRVRGGGLLRRATRRSMWVQAPFLLIRFPALLLAVGGAIAVLVAAVASGPLFLSSAQNAALEKQLAPVSRWNGGLTIVATGRVAGPLPYGSPYGVGHHDHQLGRPGDPAGPTRARSSHSPAVPGRCPRPG